MRCVLSLRTVPRWPLNSLQSMHERKALA
jgi:hypothetical protein